MKSTLKTMVISLTSLTLIVGLALAAVKILTDEPIAKAQEQALNNALQEVLPTFDNIEASQLPDGQTIYTATSNEELSGIAVETYTDEGFGGRISILVGFDKNNTLHGYRVLSHSETPGLGANMDSWFMAEETTHNVVGSTGELHVKADGGDIDAMTGATITSRAFLGAVNRARTVAQNSKQQ